MQQNPGVYFEIPVLDLERAMRFYTAVFGYQFQREEIHGNAMACSLWTKAWKASRVP